MRSWLLAFCAISVGVSGAVEVVPKRLPDARSELKRGSATCSALLRFSIEKKGGNRGGDDPFGGAIQSVETLYSATLCQVTATAERTPGTGPLKVIGPASVGLVVAMDSVLDRIAAERGAWPTDVTVRVTTDLPEDKKLIWEHTFRRTIGVLIASMIDGLEIAPNVVIGDFDIDAQASSYTARSNDGQLLQKVLGHRVKPVRVIASSFDSSRLGDLAMDAGWQSLCQIQLLGGDTVEKALRLATAAKGDPLGDAIIGLDETNAVLAKRGGGMLKNAHVATRLDAALVAWPDNHSAQAYKRFAAEGLPKHYSPDAIWSVLSRGLTKLENPFLGRGRAEEEMKELNAALERFERKVSPDGEAVIALYRRAIEVADGREAGDLKVVMKEAKEAAIALREKS